MQGVHTQVQNIWVSHQVTLQKGSMSSSATSMLRSPMWCTSSACICITMLGAYWATSLPKVAQVLVSIQSMILVNDPYYNMPSLEDGRSSSRHGQQAQAYNHKIQKRTVRHAMLDNLAQPPAGFDQIIKYASCLCHFHNILRTPRLDKHHLMLVMRWA